jgi:sulfate adenylyltransferase
LSSKNFRASSVFISNHRSKKVNSHSSGSVPGVVSQEISGVPGDLNAPHGGALVNLMADADRGAELQESSSTWPSWDLTPRQLCDLELLLNGGFSPLRGFMGRADYESVCDTMRLANGLIWPMPITLDFPEKFARELKPGIMVALRDPEGLMLAALHVEEIWQPDRLAEAQNVFGTTDRSHPGVSYLLDKAGDRYVGGCLEGLHLPGHYDFRSLRLTPAQVRDDFSTRGWRRVVAFQTRNPMHRAHWELAVRAAQEVSAHLMIQPVVGMTKPGDVDHFTRARCYQALLANHRGANVMLSLLPLAMRMGGPREVVWHAIIRKNYGCTHFIVGRDHAGPGNDSTGRPFYEPYEGQELLGKHEKELGIQMLPFKMMVYVKELNDFLSEDQVPAGAHALNISGTELRRRLAEGREIPEWFTFPEVAKELRRSHPPRILQGFTIFFTGLSGSGKSTIAQILLSKFLEIGGRSVTLLDGDLVRKHLSSELGFSKEHRDLNIRRIGYVASEITKNGGIAICAPIAPYDSVRKDVRALIEDLGGFVLVHLATPIEVCERRDRKGLYAKARAGIVQNFTGVSDPYEDPKDAELVIDTSRQTPEQVAEEIFHYLEREGFISADVCRATRGKPV